MLEVAREDLLEKIEDGIQDDDDEAELEEVRIQEHVRYFFVLCVVALRSLLSPRIYEYWQFHTTTFVFRQVSSSFRLCLHRLAFGVFNGLASMFCLALSLIDCGCCDINHDSTTMVDGTKGS